MIHHDAGTCPAEPARTEYFLVVETQKMEPGMRYCDSIFGQLLKSISRRQFAKVVERHDGDAYDKSFHSWSHLIAMIFAQVSGTSSLRALESVWNANAHQHYHLGADRLSRSTLSDANRRRPVAIFEDVFAMLSGGADRTLRQEGAAMIRLIDSSPIPLGEIMGQRAWNGRIKGMKLHVVYDPHADRPCRIDITPANVNDIEIGRELPIERGSTYVFDKGYCSYPWWSQLHAAGARFVTRKKDNARFRSVRKRALTHALGDGFAVIEDCEVKLASKGDSKLAFPLRRIKVKRESGGSLTLITNDMERSAVAIAALYKARWQIELLFRWIKQHLNLATFLGRSDNAIRIQIVTAMIAYLVLRLAARDSRSAMQAIRFANLVASALFQRKPLERLDKPPDVNACKPKPRTSINQLELCYA
jgi:putative transposase